MTIDGLLDERRFSVSLQAREKAAVLEELAQLVAAGSDLDPAQLLAALQNREAEGSTGFENGVAIPHARLAGDVPFVLGVAVSKRGVAFDSVDGKPSKLFFVFMGPDSEPQEYLRTLAHISRLGLDDRVRRELIGSRDETSLLQGVRRHLTPIQSRATDPQGATLTTAFALMVVVLSEPDELDDLMTLFVERGVHGASVLESRSMGAALGQVPVFGSFMDFLGEGGGTSRTVITMVPTTEMSALVNSIEELFGDLDRRSGIAVMATELSLAKGTLGTV